MKIKKVLVVMLSLLMLVGLAAGCSSGEKGNGAGEPEKITAENDKRTLDDAKKAFTDAGIDLKNEEKPFYTTINAEDGISFYNGDNVVKIYKYADKASLDKAMEEFKDVIGEMPTNGLFVLDTSDSKSIEIFNAWQ